MFELGGAELARLADVAGESEERVGEAYALVAKCEELRQALAVHDDWCAAPARFAQTTLALLDELEARLDSDEAQGRASSAVRLVRAQMGAIAGRHELPGAEALTVLQALAGLEGFSAPASASERPAVPRRRKPLSATNGLVASAEQVGGPIGDRICRALVDGPLTREELAARCDRPSRDLQGSINALRKAGMLFDGEDFDLVWGERARWGLRVVLEQAPQAAADLAKELSERGVPEGLIRPVLAGMLERGEARYRGDGLVELVEGDGDA